MIKPLSSPKKVKKVVIKPLEVPLKLEKPLMTDESGAKYRQYLIEKGTINPGPHEEKFMSSEEVAELKKLLIEKKLLTVGVGLKKFYRPRIVGKA